MRLYIGVCVCKRPFSKRCISILLLRRPKKHTKKILGKGLTASFDFKVHSRMYKNIS